MIEFKCGICGQSLRTPGQLAGRSVRCPRCSNVIVAPAPGAALDLGVAASPREQLAASTSTMTQTAPISNRTSMAPPSGRTINFPCSYCSSPLEARSSQSGTHCECPTCGQDILVPIVDAYGRLIDPMSGKIIKPDPHPVHAYAAAGDRAPRVVRRPDGTQAIHCPRCRAASKITSNNCDSCGAAFTMEGTVARSFDTESSLALASLVTGVVGVFTFCVPVLAVVAIILGAVGFVRASGSTDRSGRTMSIVGIILGVVGLALASLQYLR